MRGKKAFVLTAVIAIFAVVLAAKVFDVSVGVGPSTAGPGGAGTGAMAEYERALESGLPVYILFHSTTCVPCIEIEAVAETVLPEYEGRVAFVDAVTDRPGVRELASRFPFRYIPTSFFLDADGEVVDSHTGVLSEEEMHARLEGLTR